MIMRLELRHWVLVAAAAALIAGNSAAIPAEGRVQDVTAAALQHGATAADAAHAGIWKAVIPPRGTMHGEFENNDPFGVSVGVKIEADCSLNWVDPDSGKLYCFSSATSLVYFLDAPHSYLARARKKWIGLAQSADARASER
jgi:hypothetical protein